MADKKIVFTKTLASFITKLAECADLAATLTKVARRRKLKSGEPEQIIDSDILAETGLTKAEFGAMVNIAGELDKVCNNPDVITGDWGDILDKCRTDL